MDAEAAGIQSDESPETTLDRTRHLLARSRKTLDAATRQLNKHEDEYESTRQSGGSVR